MGRRIYVGGVYKHFKGQHYKVIAIAEYTEVPQHQELKLVVYEALYPPFKTYARPLKMFASLVDRQKYPDAEQSYRFELVSRPLD